MTVSILRFLDAYLAGLDEAGWQVSGPDPKIAHMIQDLLNTQYCPDSNMDDYTVADGDPRKYLVRRVVQEQKGGLHAELLPELATNTRVVDFVASETVDYLE